MKTSRKKRNMLSKSALSAICFLLILFCGIGGTLAFIVAKTDSITNVFTTAKVNLDVQESFDGTVKSEIVVNNKGDAQIYVRVKLITYRVDENGNPIGGEATIPTFTLGSNWKLIGNCYYYLAPLGTGESTSDLLATSIELKEYDDANGGKQVVEVLSEAIQANPLDAVEEAWGADVKKAFEDYLDDNADTSEIVIN